MINLFKKLLWWKKRPLKPTRLYTFLNVHKIELSTEHVNHINIDIKGFAPWIAKNKINKLTLELSQDGKYDVRVIGKI